MAAHRIIRLLTGAVLATGAALALGSPALASRGIPYLGPGPHYGNNPAAVQCVQRALHIDPDGRYGQGTYDAVRIQQAGWGMSVDGVVGPDFGDRLLRNMPQDEQQRCYPLLPTSY